MKTWRLTISDRKTFWIVEFTKNEKSNMKYNISNLVLIYSNTKGCQLQIEKLFEYLNSPKMKYQMWNIRHQIMDFKIFKYENLEGWQLQIYSNFLNSWILQIQKEKVFPNCRWLLQSDISIGKRKKIMGTNCFKEILACCSFPFDC